MAKKSLADLASAFATKASGESNHDQSWRKFFQFWRADTDTTSVVRFLPDADEDNGLGFLVENLAHELNINGKREKVACLKMYGEACPICELSQKYYDEKDPEHNEALGKKYYRKKSYIGQVLVIESPVEVDQTEPVKLIDFGPKIFKQMQAAFQSGDLEEAPYELQGGYNFRIKKTKSGDYADYGTSSFSPKQTNVDEDVLENLNLYNLSDFRTPKLSRDVLEAMLLADQTGNAFAGDKAEDEKPAPASAAKTPKAEEPKEAAKAEAAPAPAGEKKQSVVEVLRARAAAQKAKADAE